MTTDRAIFLAISLVALGCGGAAAEAAPPAAATSPESTAPAAAARPSGERGGASYYSDKLAGRPTASGEPYKPSEMTAAHRSLPFGTIVEVVREDGRKVEVRINDSRR
ncbi:MAG: septal ring lytic transglycosylase RlpA family protein [Polyangiaceae bacterium]|nr:septal ring lytic transglycosylase RlpA family protein [Polyangiaceae bacterium]